MRLLRLLSGVLLAASAAQAGEASPYSVQAKATRAGDDILVTLTVMHPGADGRPKVFLSPRLMFKPGQLANISAGSTMPPDEPRASHCPARFSGLPDKVRFIGEGFTGQVLSAKGSDDVAVVSFVTMDDDVVWADVTTVKVENEAGATPDGAGGRGESKADQVHAAGRQPYSVEAKATWSGDQILVKVTISNNRTEGISEVLASPRVLMRKGQRAKIAVGTTGAPASGPAAPADAAAEKMDLMCEVINAKGSDSLVVVSYVDVNDVRVWTEAAMVKVQPAADGMGGGGGGMMGGGGGGGSASGARIQPANGLPARRVEIEWKYRNPAGEGEWHAGTSRLLTGGPAPLNLWEVNGSVYELTPWDGKTASIKGMNGRVVPASPEEFDKGQIRASKDQFKSGGQAPYPIAVGKVFAIHYRVPGADQQGEALLRIRRVEPGGVGSANAGASSLSSGVSPSRRLPEPLAKSSRTRPSSVRDQRH